MALRKSVWENRPWPGEKDWRGDNAVDGRYTNRSAQGGQCVISRDRVENATWKVDLGGVVSISHIYIYYRTENMPRTCCKGDICSFSFKDARAGRPCASVLRKFLFVQ